MDAYRFRLQIEQPVHLYINEGNFFFSILRLYNMLRVDSPA